MIFVRLFHAATKATVKSKSFSAFKTLFGNATHQQHQQRFKFSNGNGSNSQQWFRWNGGETLKVSTGTAILFTLPAALIKTYCVGSSALLQCEGNHSATLLQPPAVLLQKPITTTEDASQKGSAATVLWGLICEDPVYLMMSVGIILLSTVTSLSIPSITSSIFEATREHDTAKLKGLIVNYIGIHIALALLESARHYILSLTAEQVKAKLRSALYSALLKQEISFFDRFRSGELMNLMSGDVILIQQAVVQHFASAVGCVVEFVGAMYRLYTLSPAATAAMICIIPVLSGGVVFSQRISRGLAAKSRKHGAETMNLASEVFANIRTVHSFGSEQREASKFNEELEQGFYLEKRYRIFNGFWHLGFHVVTGVLMGLGLHFGCKMVMDSNLSVSTVSQFTQYAWRAGGALGRLLHVTGEAGKAMDAGQRVFDVVNRTPAFNPRGLQPLTAVGKIELKNVHFAYPTRPEQEVLKGFSIVLNPGTVTALAGASGGGKSTITALVDRFYDASSGEILFDGINIKDLDLMWLRKHIGLVGQEPVLFAGTVADNIRYGCPEASEDQVITAAKEANADSFIRTLPLGYNTVVGHVGLSAGQRQRIAIARALLKNPTVLILDEATSQLDAESEHLVQQALDRLMMGRTVLIIAHRLSTVQHADKIAVIHNGKVAEMGSHQELMQRKGIYSLLVDRQIAAVFQMQ